MKKAILVRNYRLTALSILALAAGTAALIGPVFGATYSGAEPMSFDMWCFDMQRYPEARCHARGADDVKAYEHYRTTSEQYEQQRADKGKRDQEIKDRLNRTAGSTKQ